MTLTHEIFCPIQNDEIFAKISCKMSIYKSRNLVYNINPRREIVGDIRGMTANQSTPLSTTWIKGTKRQSHDVYLVPECPCRAYFN